MAKNQIVIPAYYQFIDDDGTIEIWAHAYGGEKYVESQHKKTDDNYDEVLRNCKEHGEPTPFHPSKQNPRTR